MLGENFLEQHTRLNFLEDFSIGSAINSWNLPEVISSIEEIHSGLAALLDNDEKPDLVFGTNVRPAFCENDSTTT